MMSKLRLGNAILIASVIIFSTLAITWIPTTTAASSTHIVSFVKQKKAKSTYDEFAEFDFERVKQNNSTNQIMQNGIIDLVVGRLSQQLITVPGNNVEDVAMSAITENINSIADNSTRSTDDAPDQNQNTLENTMDLPANNMQDETTMPNNNIGNNFAENNRVKQSIPVLEPVKHLLNTVRDGAFGNTNHTSSSHHPKHQHQLLNADGSESISESPAIETEEEREMVNESQGFRLLELLGSFAGIAWGFLTNLQKIFAASSGSASSSSSGQ